MNKADLVDAIARGVDGLSKAKAEEVLNATLSAIIGAVAGGDTVSLVGFGSLGRGERTTRVARNPRTGEEISVPAVKTVKFKAGQRFKDAVNAMPQ